MSAALAQETSASLRIIMTVASLNVDHGGPSRTIPALCDALDRIGVSAPIVTRDETGAGRAALQNARRTSVRLIHDNGMWLPSNHAAAVAARRLGVPFVVSPRGMLEPWSLQHRGFKKRIAWRVFARRDLEGAALLHATSVMEAENFRALGLRQPAAVIPNGVDLPEMPDDRPRAEVRTALFLSRVHPKKGLLNLVAAWARVRPPGWRLVIAGPDESGHRAEVEVAIRTARLESTVSFAGSVAGEAKRRLFLDADLFILPTYSENFGVAVAEALAHGVPVITTRAAPWSDLESERCGWWISTGVDPLATTLNDATRLDDDTRIAMGQRGRALVARNFAWDGIARNMRDVYRWLIDGGASPACVRHD